MPHRALAKRATALPATCALARQILGRVPQVVAGFTLIVDDLCVRLETGPLQIDVSGIDQGCIDHAVDDGNDHAVTSRKANF